MTRPTSVSVIGWLFVGFGALTAMGGLFGLAISFVMPFPPPGELAAARDNMPAPFGLMTYMFDYFWVMALGQLIVAGLMIAAGAAFLKLRSWGRTVLEAITWAGLAYLLAFGTFWVWAVS